MHLPRRLRTLLRVSSNALLTGVLAAFGVVAGGIIVAGAVTAQAPSASSQKTAQGIVPPPPPPVTFQAIRQAVQSQDHTIVQLRRFRDDAGNIVAVRECLQVDANGTDSPVFTLTFVGVEGQLPGSPIFTKWQQTYTRFGRLFYRHASFHVRDDARADQNYTLHDFGVSVRAGRSVRRLVVFPQATDKAIWLIDVDAQTLIPLYTAEFDGQLRLLTEVEAQVFTPAVQLAATAYAATTATVLVDFAAAQSHLGMPTGVVDPDVSTAVDYQLARIEVRDDPLTGLQKLIMSYTDGVDEFMVIQTPNSPDMFEGLTEKMPGTNHTIARYRDPAMSVLLFWDDGVAFQVAGRGALQRLDEVSRRVYLQALSTN